MRDSILIFLLIMLAVPGKGWAQEVVFEEMDTVAVFPSDSTIRAVIMAADSLPEPVLKVRDAFKPDPNRALLYSIVPGMGQIYNRKYWKLPIVYGALMGCTYAITWNNKNYQDYKQAYFDILSSDPVKNNSWMDFIPNETEEGKLSYITNTDFINNKLKRQKDYFRRYRDMSILITIGVYALSIIDAYVDAQLFDFDISPDLSMRVEPTYTPRTSYSSHTYGLNCSIKF